jgi:peptide deformylase
MLDIITLGDGRLRKHSILVPEIDGEVTELAKEMFASMYANKGVGLAAVQVGSLLRLFITDVEGDGPRVFINPEIIETSVEQGAIEEGCLSLPNLNADVIRPLQVRVQAWNERGKPFALDAEGMLARAVQHELDHLNGVLFIDRIAQKKRDRLLKVYSQKN